MRGVQTSRRLEVGTPLTRPLRGHPLREGEGCLSSVHHLFTLHSHPQHEARRFRAQSWYPGWGFTLMEGAGRVLSAPLLGPG
jgi:hypothetical protein